jgi:cytochrome c biogenesis protein CcdA
MLRPGRGYGSRSSPVHGERWDTRLRSVKIKSLPRHGFALPVLAFFLLGSQWAGAQALPGYEITPAKWKYGMIDQGDIATTRVEAWNRGDRPLRLSFVSTCDCLTASPSVRTIAPGASGSFDLSFDSKDYSGITTRGFIINTDLPGAKPGYYLLYGVVRVESKAPPSAAQGQWSLPSQAEGAALTLSYYFTEGCKSCEEFLSVEIPKLESRLGISIKVEKKDILDPKNYEELSAAALAMGQKIEALPALTIGGRLVQGDARIRAELPGLLTGASGAASGTALSAAQGGKGVAGPQGLASERLALLPIMAAGLIDGVNPCAFTTLIFLLASLALAGRGRREVLVIGALFSLSVFLTYLGVGLGLFAALRAASAVALVSKILRWAIFAVLIAFAALSVYDYTRIRAGAPSEMLLQLPNYLKLKIHSSIRTRAKTLAIAGSSLVMGFLVSIFEFACTAQVYLPTLAYLARVQRRTDALGLLLLYNLCFIAPLLVVFAASYLGVSSKRITALFQKQMGKVKLALAFAFLVLAAVTALT